MRPALVDTNVVIDVLRGNEAARSCLAGELRGPGLFGSTVTQAEVLAGMRRGEESRTLDQLDVVRWLAVDQLIADRAGELARAHRNRHPGIELSDYLIAATADLLGLRLLTCNVKHFPMFKRIRPAY